MPVPDSTRAQDINTPPLVPTNTDRPKVVDGEIGVKPPITVGVPNTADGGRASVLANRGRHSEPVSCLSR